MKNYNRKADEKDVIDILRRKVVHLKRFGKTLREV